MSLRDPQGLYPTLEGRRTVGELKQINETIQYSKKVIKFNQYIRKLRIYGNKKTRIKIKKMRKLVKKNQCIIVIKAHL